MSLGECLYKSHIDSIDRDQKKKKKIEDFRNNIDRNEKRRMNKKRYGQNKNGHGHNRNNNNNYNGNSYNNRHNEHNSFPRSNTNTSRGPPGRQARGPGREPQRGFNRGGEGSRCEPQRGFNRGGGGDSKDGNNVFDYKNRFNTESKFVWGKKVS
jgi:hypothetical protein